MLEFQVSASLSNEQKAHLGPMMGSYDPSAEMYTAYMQASGPQHNFAPSTA